VLEHHKNMIIEIQVDVVLDLVQVQMKKNDKLSKDERREMRRIRNKDRPSLEIYQPGRLRLSRTSSDGRASVEPKESKSNPPSDGESVKKPEKIEKSNETGIKRKVSRYSERTRSGRIKEKSEKSNSDKDEKKSESDAGCEENSQPTNETSNLEEKKKRTRQ